jgi:hypothetical protein
VSIGVRLGAGCCDRSCHPRQGSPCVLCRLPYNLHFSVCLLRWSTSLLVPVGLHREQTPQLTPCLLFACSILLFVHEDATRFHRNVCKFLRDYTAEVSTLQRGTSPKTLFAKLWLLKLLRLVSRDSAVAVATSYWLDDRGVGVRVPVGSKILTSPCYPNWLWVRPTSYLVGTGGSFPGGKAAEAWSWPLTSN